MPRRAQLKDAATASASTPELDNRTRRKVGILQRAIAAQDDSIETHLRRVNRHALAIAMRLGLAPAERQAIHIASLLHDLGKLGVPESTSSQAEPLSPRDLQLLQQHSKIGARILAEVEGCAAAAVLVLHLHERYDGACAGALPGYPRGLRGEEIPLGSRIIAVAEAFDAITSDRPYRQALTPAAALAILREESGHQFDPRVVDALVGLVEEAPVPPAAGRRRSDERRIL